MKYIHKKYPFVSFSFFAVVNNYASLAIQSYWLISLRADFTIVEEFKGENSFTIVKSARRLLVDLFEKGFSF